MSPVHPFWRAPHHARRRDRLVRRARLKSAIRAHFDARDFLEVETGIVQVSPGNETHLHAFEAHWLASGDVPQQGYLHTSPEFAMKKLLAAGERRIYQFAPVFRAREASRLHAPEFTMLEWYRSGEDYTALMADCADLLRLATEIGGQDLFQYRGQSCNPRIEPERLSVSEAFERHAGIDLDAHLADRDGFAEAARGIGLRIAPDDGWTDVFSRVISERIEPHLGLGRATILDRYPVSEAALARPCPDDPRFSERFELYACGVELANAFGELTDPAEQRRRFEADMAEKERLYGESYPLDEDFLDALADMPPASGIALGFDRLAMLATGAEDVAGVIFTPWPFPEGEA
ncbi:EF-P lysine aminoacylase EpmA [Rhabdaerophilum sp. SD176]|uniref:EF-P lysine aminoacylase EpmA n=1 Tax=Rhabdaerophilum sp. SD176 TaxID=2983548 RepID=UPI0024DF6D11|nr:EF-P lysine aminoacylase EpmA [Rhabdaerophilum sp. SD176]